MSLMLDEALKLIVHYEGFREKAYLCPANVWTVGHGFTTHPDGRPVKQGDTISQAASLQRLRAKIDTTGQAIQRAVKQPLTPYQVAALVAFTFNVGMGAFQSSTLKKRLDEGNFAAAAAEFDRWDKVNGKPLAGLTKRRAAERALFCRPYSTPSPPAPIPPVPSPSPSGARATLRKGMTHPDVKVLQGYLGLASSDQTGFFGDLTEQRVKQFQQAHGLTADGVVGAGTWQRLQR